MKEISINELKQLQVDMLEKIHQFCIKNKINYFISYGTLIGAIRHKGYIPWDEDVDISMPRPDYERFIYSFNGAYPELNVIAPELNWDYFEPYANVFDNRTILFEEENPHHGIEVGIKIDVFPVDGVPDDKKEYFYLRKKIRKLNRLRGLKKISIREQLYNLWKNKRGIRSMLIRMAHPFISYSDIQKQIRKLAVSNDYNSSNNVEQIVFQPKFGTQLDRHLYKDYIDVFFEGHCFKTIRSYDRYLTIIYGDYMKLPPVEEQVYKHGFSAYWKD